MQTPKRCPVCNKAVKIIRAGFEQVIPQDQAQPVVFPWWECRSCGGWFIGQIPTPDVFSRFSKTQMWADPVHNDAIAQGKQAMTRQVLDGLARRAPKGELLDVGCHMGAFLGQARTAGWQPKGFEPSETAREYTSNLGFDVRGGWDVGACGFNDAQFQAVVAIDSFCYSWHPYQDLRTFHRLLSPGGGLAMRLTNKRRYLGWLRRMTAPGPRRNLRISHKLITQFHAVSISSITRILREVGFIDICVVPRAAAAPKSAMHWKSRLAYTVADVANWTTLGWVNLSPGILVFARKDPL